MCWSGLPFPFLGDLPDLGIKPMSPPLAGRFSTTGPQRKSSLDILRVIPRSILKFEILLGTLDATPKFPNILVSLQGYTEVPGVSREVPCSALKGETVLDTLDATAKVPRHAGFPRSDPMDCSPPGSPVPGILQARTLEWSLLCIN